MRRKQALAAVLAGLVAVLGAVLALVLTMQPGETEDSVSPLPLSDYAAGEIDALEYTWQGETVRLARLEDDSWAFADEPDVPVTQSLVNSMATGLGALTASRDLGEAENLEEYGLAEPSLVVTVTVGDSQYTYQFGDTNDVTDEVYLLCSGDGHLYTAGYTKASLFHYTAADLVDTSASGGEG